MHLQYNPYIWIYLAVSAVLLQIVVYMMHKRIAERLWIVMQIMVIIWCLGFALQISASSLKAAHFWYVAANDFVGLKTPVVWFLWSLSVTGRQNWITRRRVAALFALPVVTDILNLTNSAHGLVYRRMWLNTVDGYPFLEYNVGPWYWVITSYCGLLLLAVIIVQAKSALNRQLLYRKQGLTIAAATAAVLLFIIISITAQSLLIKSYDLTPVVIGIAAISTALVFRFRAQEAVPVPRGIVMEKMSSAVLILDNRNRIMDINPAAEAFFGIKAAKVAGRAMEEVLEDWPELTAASRDKSVGHYEFVRDNRYYDVYFSGLNDNRKAAGYIVIVQDITKNKAVEAQIIQQQRALLVLEERARLARELHDSLGQVLGYAGIQIQAIRDLLKAGSLSAADENLVRLSQVVAEANTEMREFIYEVKTTLLFKEGFFNALRHYLAHFENNFQIKTEMQNQDNLTEDELNLLTGVQLFRIIQEALANVRKHARTSKATVTFRKKDRQIVVTVADDGMGFDPEKLAADQSSFGLQVMRERAEQIGGKIRIDSAPGRGTAVRVTIPRFTGPNEGTEPENRQIDNPAKDIKIRVLLVDDHALFMEGLQNLIRSKGYEVVGTAKDGMEALEKARLLHPEMILMDLEMPLCNGLTATRMIKAEMPEIKIVILTVSDREQDLFKAIQSGACGYLLKGLRAEEFIGQLNGLASNAAVISPEMAAQVLEEFTRNEQGLQNEADFKPAEPEEYLSKRQIEILSLVAREFTYKEVASRLFLSERTVKYEMADILRILHLQTRRQAIVYARRAGLGAEKEDRIQKTKGRTR